MSKLESRTCLKCQKDFVHELPKSKKRICPDCDKGRTKQYGKSAGGIGGRRGGKSVSSGISSN